MAIDFPDNPSHGTGYPYQGVNYTFQLIAPDLIGYWAVLSPGSYGPANGIDVDTGTDSVKYVTSIAMEDSSYIKADVLAGYVTNAAYTNAAVLGKILAVDGAASGLDAQFLAGSSLSAVLNLGNHTGALPVARGGTGAISTTGGGSVNVRADGPTFQTNITTPAIVMSGALTMGVGATVVCNGQTITDDDLSRLSDIGASSIGTQLSGKASTSSVNLKSNIVGPTFSGNVWLPTTSRTTGAGGMLYMSSTSNTGGKVTVSSSAPSSPANGDIWLEIEP